MTSHQNSLCVTIIGAGFSGTMCAYHFLRSKRPGLKVILIGNQSTLGRGIAYSTPQRFHLLNVPAAKMTALPDEPDNFLNWAKTDDPRIEPTDFLPRHLYGSYIQSLFDAAKREKTEFEYKQVEAQSITNSIDSKRFRLTLSDASSLESDYLILALGHGQEKSLPGLGASNANIASRIINPWNHAEMDKIGSNQNILLVGTGLTMLDAALFFKERQHSGRLLAISRRGLLPAPHLAKPLLNSTMNYNDCFSSDDGLLCILQKLNNLRPTEVDRWREYIDCLRPETSRIWQAMSVKERRSFLRHLVPYWDIHRHRAAAQIRHSIDQMINSGQLEVKAGRIKSIAEHSNGLSVTVQERGALITTNHKFDFIISCLGPESDVSKWHMPLVKDLLKKGLLQQDELKLGLRTNQQGQALNSQSVPNPRLYLIGPARKADLWESIAVPELRVQAADVARRIIKE